MNGAHDLGGMHGFGAIDVKPGEPVFHAEWERRAFALTLACGFLGAWNLDESRHARERQHPAVYLANGYYENWLAGLETLLREKDLLGDATAARFRLKRLPPERVRAVLKAGGSVEVEAARAPSFEPGQRVRVRNRHRPGHTRAPRYTAGRLGVVHAHHGCHVFPDANAAGERAGRHLYSVRFASVELWGAGDHAVYVDLWEPYLEAVDG